MSPQFSGDTDQSSCRMSSMVGKTTSTSGDLSKTAALKEALANGNTEKGATTVKAEDP